MDNMRPVTFGAALRSLRLHADDIEWEGGTVNTNTTTLLAYYQETVNNGGSERVAYFTNK